MQRVFIIYTIPLIKRPCRDRGKNRTQKNQPAGLVFFVLKIYLLLRLSEVFVEIRDGLNTLKVVEYTVVLVWTMDGIRV